MTLDRSAISIHRSLNSLISAIQFLTVLPVGRPGAFDPQGMVKFFPVVGIILGTLVSMLDRVFLQLWPSPVVALLDVLLLIALTGAFHLDGLGDAADGLYGHNSREKALTIMKDSRIGVMGLIAIIAGLSLKWGGIMILDAHRTLLLIIIPAYARGAMLFGIRFLEYGRPGGGTGHDLFVEPLKLSAFWGLLIPVTLSCFLGWRAIWLNFIFILLTASLLFFYKKRLACVTGDMLGAMCEVIESGLFLMVFIGGAV